MDNFVVKYLSTILIAISLFVIAIGIRMLVLKDVFSDEARLRRCPRCGKRPPRKARSAGKKSPFDNTWVCSRCGNDADEFGNKL